MSGKRVLLMCGSLSPGGIQMMVLLEAGELASRGYDVDICVMSTEEGSLASRAKDMGISVYTTCSPRNLPGFIMRFSSILEKGKYDIVHVHRSSHFSALPLVIARRKGVPVRIAHYQNIDRGGIRGLAVPVLRKLVLSNATTILGAATSVLCSQFSRDYELEDLFAVLPNALDCSVYDPLPDGMEVREEFRIDKESFVLGHCSRFSPAKNQRFLIELLPDLITRVPDLKLLLLGEGPQLNDCKEHAKALGVEDYVLFPGWKDVYRTKAYAAFDLFLFPSRWEGFGIVLLEAQASGVPCIASDLDCFEGVLSPMNALLSRSILDRQAWIDVIVKLHADASLREAVGEEGRAHAMQFDKKLHVDQLLRYYHRAGGDES